MSSRTISPPQTYSRLFRPWDVDQDSTVTSTSAKKLQENSGSCEKLSDPIKSEYDLANAARISQRLFDLHEHQHPSLYTTSQHNEELQHIPQNQSEAMAFYASYPEFMTSIPSGSYMSGAASIDAITMNAMEQEYARVLAEEAQSKILSARKQRPKKFKCPHCDVAFSNNGQLKGHVRIHTGNKESPYIQTLLIQTIICLPIRFSLLYILNNHYYYFR